MIVGERIRLRPIERDDLPRFVAWFADPEVRDGLSIFMPIGLAEEEQWFEAMLKEEKARRPLSIDARAVDGWAHIGSAGFHQIDWRNRNAEFGIAIGDKQYWNTGYGADAVRTLIGFGFGELNLERIYLRVFHTNLRAIRCYEKAGFAHEGRLRRDRFHAGRYDDTLIMGILRDEWEKNRG
ncbi:MAG: GNAT family N-acetyltransferase [Chloroflexi bacterium]|nr:GNAT family N-acetyltransferase [Chloroflexota bacterium]